MPRHRDALIAFAKPPARGRVKTRLEPLLGSDAALALHGALLRDTVCRIERLAVALDGYLYLAWESGDAYPVPVRMQRGADLGERLKNAFAQCFSAGHERVAAVGIDSPTLSDATVLDTYRLLREVDLVLGPCGDGGYYLIGMSRMQPRLFEGIDWGSDRVLVQTTGRAASLGLRLALLPELFDVDRPEDLAVLEAALDQAQEPDSAPHTREVLRSLRSAR